MLIYPTETQIHSALFFFRRKAIAVLMQSMFEQSQAPQLALQVHTAFCSGYLTLD